jgi:hypothetical protein
MLKKEKYREVRGVLKRLKATPLNAFEYLTAQAISRIFLLMFTLVIVWTGCDLIFSFRVQGSYLDLFAHPGEPVKNSRREFLILSPGR